MPRKAEDLTARVFGQLTVLFRCGWDKFGNILWECRCTCGVDKEISAAVLRRGTTVSCGCHRRAALKAGREALVKRATTHGKSRTREYRIWANAIYRCTTPTCPGYADYGERGIKVCERWQDFENFLADMGPCPPRFTLDRIDNDGDYTPENCRWATRKQQANNRRTSQWFTYKGEKRTAAEWCKRLKMNKATFWSRVRDGWSIERIVETPIQPQRR